MTTLSNRKTTNRTVEQHTWFLYLKTIYMKDDSTVLESLEQKKNENCALITCRGQSPGAWSCRTAPPPGPSFDSKLHRWSSHRRPSPVGGAGHRLEVQWDRFQRTGSWYPVNPVNRCDSLGLLRKYLNQATNLLNLHQLSTISSLMHQFWTHLLMQ